VIAPPPIATPTDSTPTSPPDPLSVPAEVYARACQSLGLRGGYIGGLERYRVLFRTGRIDPALGDLRLPAITRTHTSECSEGTVLKFVLPVPGRADKPGETLETESVVIPMIGKKRVLTHTLCVSSQVGCAMGCGFCQTAQMGLLRNLTAREIVQQWFIARHVAAATPPAAGPGTAEAEPAAATGFATIRNLVFMGMGEPMDNLDEVLAAIEVLTDHNGVNLPMSKVTISTVGRVDGIRRLAEHIRRPGWHRLNLAISLNAPTDDIRAAIMPINRRYPLKALREGLEAWPLYAAAKICFEYVLIPGVNDEPAHARLVADFVLGRGEYAGRPPLHGLVNVIPYNPREQSPWPAPEESRVEAFINWLLDAGVYAKRRRTKGRDTMAACGQLGNPAIRRKIVNVSTPTR
jgi:23S rRNA (adenine2503-C2)-methyltransferase